MTVRYLLGSQSQVMWGDEGATPYTKATTLNKPFGIVGEDIDFPPINPRVAKATAGGSRAPHLFSQEEYDLQFGIGFEIQNDQVPFMCAIGTDSAISGTGYTGTKFTASDRLETVSVRREQKDGALQDDFIGCKADLMLSGKKGEAVKAQMDFLAAARDTDVACAAFTTCTIPTTQPFRFWMLGAVTLADGASIDDSIASINSFDIGWKNGLAARGNAGDGTRGAYCVVEEEAEGRYDVKLGVSITDNQLFQYALDGDVDIDVVIPLLRDGAASIAASTDCMLIYLNDCVVLDTSMPYKAKGDIQGEVILGPKSTQIDIRTPSA